MSFKHDKEKNQKEQSEEKAKKEREENSEEPIVNTGVAPDEHPKPNPGTDADAASG